ncbi:MAG TPA: serine/threonine-protein kinase [Polyangiaceae bacterium]|nr:serine/threonine-protein kinase [Polyangiaceae bacterium]
MSAPLAHPPAQVLDEKYALIRELGSGGAGTVYEAEHLIVGKRLAIKILHAAVAGEPEVRARFEAEARAAARIAHANVVDIHDLGVTAEGVPYLVMELLEGETFAQMAARAPLQPAYACELVLQLLAGLSAAHRKGIVHCDLKPANVMVTHPRQERPLVKVLDFGVARTLRDPPPGTPSIVIGTPMYMAPEQVCGQAIDERTDVYSTCAILFVLLTGQDPFQGGTSQQVMERVARGECRSLLAINPAVPPALAALVARGMARLRRARIGSTEELAEQLRDFLHSTRLGSPPTAALEGPPNLLPLVPHPTAVIDATPSLIPVSARLRLDVTRRLVTDSLLLAPRLPKPPGAPRLKLGDDFRLLLSGTEREDGDGASLLVRARTRLGPALLAMLIGFAVGVLVAWLTGMI